MTNHTPSINDISIAINSIFMDITDPIMFGLNKSNLFERYKNLNFRFDRYHNFEFSTNPILQFEDSDYLLSFLKREMQLANTFQDTENYNEIQDLMNENKSSVVLDNFYINYSIEISENEILILFNSNSLVFKYEIVG